MIDSSELESRFLRQPRGDEDIIDAHIREIRETCSRLAHKVNIICPDGREKSLAMTKLEEVVFWAGEALLRRQKVDS